MSQIQTTNWSQTAASNNAASPNGAPEGMPPSGVNDTIRELMSALKIDWCNVHGLDSSNALLSSAGSGTTRTLTFSTAPASLYTGLIVSFKAGSDFDASSTLNINALGAKNIQRMTASGYGDIIAGDIISGQHVVLKYDATLGKLIMLSPVGTAAAAGTVTSVATSGLATGGPITGTGTVTVSITAQTLLNAVPATDDEIAVYDTSAAAHRKVTWDNLVPDASTSQEGKVELATEAEMETATDTGRVPSVSVVKHHPGVAKAWCNFVGSTVGTNAPTAGYNVTSVQRTSAGNYVINFTTAFADTNYIMVHAHLDASSNATGQYLKLVSKTASAATVRFNVNGTATDVDEVHAAFFGTQ